MTPKELRAAAGITNHFLERDEDDLNMIAGHIETIARHILATVRDDDDELFNAEYVDVHFSPTPQDAEIGEPVWYWMSDGLFLLRDEYGVWTINTPDSNEMMWHPVARIKTRGQFRKLCEGLGIVLKENAQ